MAATDLWAAADALRDWLVDGLDTDAPALVRVQIGTPALDCEGLIIAIMGVDATVDVAPARGMHPDALYPIARYTVTLVECHPAGSVKPATTAQIEAAHAPITAHGWRLWNVAATGMLTGELIDACDARRVGPLQAAGPEGALVGWSFDVWLALDGYLALPPDPGP